MLNTFTRNGIILYKNIIFLLFSLFVLTNGLNAHDCISMDKAKNIYEGIPDKPILVLNQNITLEQAYCGQQKLNYLLNKKYKDKIGYKVGFTGKATQKMFDIKTPATGIIYKHMFIENNGKIDHNFGYRPFIEPDFLVVIKNSDIMLSKTPLEVLSNLKSIHPYLELPALRFQEGTKINGKMMIAANILATKMIMGEGIKVEATEKFLDKIANLETLFLDQNNNIIQSAKASNLMGNPINVLMWLIEDFNNRKIALKENDRISLGSVGKLFPLKENTQYTYKFIGFKKELSLTLNVN
jgi:2-oxo-hept-3-ene-1,7-dioate hydratase